MSAPAVPSGERLLVPERLSPAPDAGGELHPFDRLWHFFQDTGFIYPGKLALLRPYLREVYATGKRLFACPEDLCKITLVERDGRINNSLFMTRYYPHTWLVHQMASRSNPFGMLRLLMRSVDWLLDRPDFRYARLYWRPNNERVDNLFLGLGRAMTEAGARVTALKTLAYHHLPLEQVEARLSWPDRRLTIDPVAPEGHWEVSRLLRRALGRVDYQVEALAPRTLTLSDLDEMFQQHGLFRRRTVFTSRRGERILGVALAEQSSPGLNLSFYFNTFQVAIVDEDLTEDDKLSVIHGLLRRLCRHYHDQGRDFLITLADPFLNGHLVRLGFAAAKQYNCLSLSRPADRQAGLRYFLDYYRGKSSDARPRRAAAKK
jgi:hypothetical protein